MGGRRAAIAVIAAAAFAAGAAVAAGDEKPKERRPTGAELRRIQDRIDRSWGVLDRQGIYVVSTGLPARPCVGVTLANPTRANIAYVERRFGPHVCVDRRPGGEAQFCAGTVSEPLPTGPVSVPDLRGLGMRAAARRTLALGLNFAYGCSGPATARDVVKAARHPLLDGAQITRQCPRPGEMVEPGTMIDVATVTQLPGGFRFRQSNLTYYVTGTKRPCEDGRHASPPGRP